MKNIKTENLSLFVAIFLVFPFFKGLHDLLSVYIVATIMIVATILKCRKNGFFQYSLDFNFIAISIWGLSYFVASFYAADKGMALMGAIKMLSIPIFLLLYFQYDISTYLKNKIYKYIAYSGALMTLLSLALCAIPDFSKYFFLSNRLQGFFFYANTFGLWLLIGIIILLFQEKLEKLDIASLVILAIGIILTNSRAIIILAVLALIVSFFFTKLDKKKYLKLSIILLVIGIGAMILLNIYSINSRLENITSSSEFLTRLLYYNDAITQIIQHPFGLGHHGWWIIQPTIQTAPYDCQYVHNAPLQIMLDVGIIPCILLIILVIKTLFDKNVSSLGKVILFFILTHAMIDFDFEFLSIIFLIVTIPNYSKRNMHIKTPQISLLILLGIFVYFALAALLFEANNAKGAYTFYPNYTFALRKGAQSAENDELKLELATRASKLDNYSYDIYNNLFEVSSNKGNIEEAYYYITKVLAANKYSMVAYIKYLNFLETAMYEYNSMSDEENVKLYMERIIEVEQLIADTLDKTNPLSFKGNHPPLLDIPEEIQAFIDEIKLYYEENYQ